MVQAAPAFEMTDFITSFKLGSNVLAIFFSVWQKEQEDIGIRCDLNSACAPYWLCDHEKLLHFLEP